MNVDDRDAPPPRNAWSGSDTLMLGSSIHPVLSRRQPTSGISTTSKLPAEKAGATCGTSIIDETAAATKTNPVVHEHDWKLRQQQLMQQQQIQVPDEPQPELHTQQLPHDLDRAVAPGLLRPTAPFAKNERKRALQSAIYYSECYLRGIKPVDADTAAFDIQHQYTKWWVESKHSAAAVGATTTLTQTEAAAPCKNDETTSDESDKQSPKKRQRVVTPLEAARTTPHSQSQPAPPRGRSQYRYSSSSEDDDVPSRSTSPAGSAIANSQASLPNPNALISTTHRADKMKDRLMNHLRDTGGDTTSLEFLSCLEYLNALYRSRGCDARASFAHPEDGSNCDPDGTWLTLTKPTFSECLGRNSDGEYMYTLGRMSFDMFRPTHLKCSIRAVMNHVRAMDPKRKPKSFPSRLLKELKREAASRGGVSPIIRHYDIVVAFTIEANQTRRGTTPPAAPASNGSGDDEFVIPRPIRGLMTNHGYMVADPSVPNRSSVWFSGGSVEAQDEVNDAEIWRNIFDESLAPRRDMRGMANMLAARLLLGAYTKTSGPVSKELHEEGDGADADAGGGSNTNPPSCPPTLSYIFKRPIGGHGEVFCDALYVDNNLRIMQGHRGSIFVFTRVPSFHEEDQETECR